MGHAFESRNEQTTTALSFKPKKETYLPLPGSLRIG